MTRVLLVQIKKMSKRKFNQFQQLIRDVDAKINTPPAAGAAVAGAGAAAAAAGAGAGRQVETVVSGSGAKRMRVVVLPTFNGYNDFEMWIQDNIPPLIIDPFIQSPENLVAILHEANKDRIKKWNPSKTRQSEIKMQNIDFLNAIEKDKLLPLPNVLKQLVGQYNQSHDPEILLLEMLHAKRILDEWYGERVAQNIFSDRYERQFPQIYNAVLVRHVPKAMLNSMLDKETQAELNKIKDPVERQRRRTDIIVLRLIRWGKLMDGIEDRNTVYLKDN